MDVYCEDKVKNRCFNVSDRACFVVGGLNYKRIVVMKRKTFYQTLTNFGKELTVPHKTFIPTRLTSLHVTVD